MRKRLLLSTLILFVASSLQVEAMQFGRPNAPQSTPPGRIPGGTPPTFPSDSHPSSTLPPDTAAPPATSSSDFKIEGLIQGAIELDSRLRHDDISVRVDDAAVTLTGEISSTEHRGRAIRIATDLAGSRTVVDRLQLPRNR